jgi:peroxiredoxin (alkyl hydroperoxide reductase subunit C)
MDSKFTPQPPMLGEQFPEVDVETTHGEMSLPDAYEGEWFVAFSHPGDFTPVCTTEFVAFEERREEFEDLGVNLIGLSVDRVHSHIKWTDWIEDELDVDIGFPIIADETGIISAKLGMLAPETGTNAVRSVLIVDPTGEIRQILQYPKEVGRNIDEILRSIRALQKSDAEDVETPADWPNNAHFGDKVLLSPPNSEADAKDRLEAAEAEGLECYDWWFCLREDE